MREASGPVLPRSAVPKPVGSADVDAAQLAHLFDYCRALLGGEAEAADTARSVIASAHSLPNDRDRRTWLFALARKQAMTLVQLGITQPSYAVPVPAATTGQQVAVLSALRALTDREREILDLVYRHGIRQAELAVVLSIPAEEAYRQLINAEEEFINLAAEPGTSTHADLDEITNLPLAMLPAPEGGDRWLSPGRLGRNADRTTSRRALVRRGIQLVAAAAVVLGVLTWAVIHFAGPNQGHGSDHASVPGGEANPSGQLSQTPHPTAALQPKKGVAPVIPISVLLPVPGQSTTGGANPPPPFVIPSPTPTSAPATTPPPTTPAPTTPPPTTPPPTTPPPTTPPPTTSPPPTSPPPSPA